MKKKIVITSGGTGGHIFPAAALGQQLRESFPHIEITFIGGNLAQNPFFEDKSFLVKSVSCATINLKKIFTLPKDLCKIALGIKQTCQLFRLNRPDLIIGFGSFYTFPVLAAARLLKIPFILHEANSLPGKVNRIFSPYALYTGFHFPSTLKHLKGKTKEVGIPLRKGFTKGHHSSKEAWDYFQLNHQKKTLLIFGGSQGAKGINRLVKEAICTEPDFFKIHFQVIHILGKGEDVRAWKDLYTQQGIYSVVKSFEDRMELAWQAADFVISRAGANTIAELLEFEIPSLLIPYPSAADNHQEINANFIVNIVKSGLLCKESELNSKELVFQLEKLMKSSCECIVAMQHYKKNIRTQTFLETILNYLRTLDDSSK